MILKICGYQYLKKITDTKPQFCDLDKQTWDEGEKYAAATSPSSAATSPPNHDDTRRRRTDDRGGRWYHSFDRCWCHFHWRAAHFFLFTLRRPSFLSS